MYKCYNFFVSSVCAVAIVSASTPLFTDAEMREVILTQLDTLSCLSEYSYPERVVDSLYGLCQTDLAKIQQLFDYFVNHKGSLDDSFLQVLVARKLIDSSGKPSASLIQTLNLLRQIIDDYNKQNKDDCCKRCCGGCFTFWCGENGKKKLKFSFHNFITIVTAISGNKGRALVNVAACVDIALDRLSSRVIERFER